MYVSISEGASCGVLGDEFSRFFLVRPVVLHPKIIASRNLCICTQVSVEAHPSEGMMTQELLFGTFGVTRLDACAPYPGACYHHPQDHEMDVATYMNLHTARMQSTDTACVILLDGRCIGTHQDGFALTWMLREARRHATHPISYTTSVSHSHDMTAVYVSTVFGRALQPLLVVDVETQRVRLQSDNMDKGIGWLLRHGFIEFLDEHEVDTLTIAMTIGDLHNWRDRGGPFTHLVPHPSMMFSACGNAGSRQLHFFGCFFCVRKKAAALFNNT